MKRGFVDTFLYWLDPRANCLRSVLRARQCFVGFNQRTNASISASRSTANGSIRAGRDTFRKESGFELPGNHYGRPETNRDWRGKEIPAQPVNQGEPVK